MLPKPSLPVGSVVSKTGGINYKCLSPVARLAMSGRAIWQLGGLVIDDHDSSLLFVSLTNVAR